MPEIKHVGTGKSLFATGLEHIGCEECLLETGPEYITDEERLSNLNSSKLVSRIIFSRQECKVMNRCVNKP